MTKDEMQKQILDAIASGKIQPTTIILGDNIQSQHNIEKVEAGGIGVKIVYNNGEEQTEHPSAKPSQRKSNTAHQSKKTIQPNRNYITFKMGNITDGHLQMLRQKLIQVGWIANDTQPDAFTKIFSGKTNTTQITWTGAVGKGMLTFLFSKMVEQRFIIVPDSHSIDTILENHFIDTDGNYLSGLNSSKESVKHLPIVKECLDILQLEVDTD